MPGVTEMTGLVSGKVGDCSNSSTSLSTEVWLSACRAAAAFALALALA